METIGDQPNRSSPMPQKRALVTKIKGCFAVAVLFVVVVTVLLWRDLITSSSHSLPLSACTVGIDGGGRHGDVNAARLSSAYDPETDSVVAATDIDKFHVITNFFVVTHPAFNTDLAALDRHSSAFVRITDRLQMRLRELTTTLQLNLDHSRVALVHVIYSHPYVSHFLSRLPLRNSRKLVLHRVTGQPTYQHAFAYAFEHLPNRLVASTNQDVFLGEGWDLVNSSLLASRRVMYALTRYAANASCPDPFTCDRSQSYVGSHDTFAFYAHRTTNASGLVQMDLKSDSLGIENVLISVFRYQLDYLVLNPCRVLKSYHLHCSNVHNRQRARVNDQTNTALAPFTERLY